MRRAPRLAMALCSALAALPGILSGQTPTILRGQVLSDEEGRPVPQVELRFPGGERVVTDGAGRFEITGLPVGDFEVVLVNGRCQYARGRVRVVRETTWESHLTLPEAMVLTPPVPQRPTGEGTFLTGPELEEMRVSDLAQALRRIAPEMVGAPGAQPGQVSRLRGRNRATFSGRTEPVIVVDGQLLGASARELQELRPADVAAFLVVPGAGGAWKYGSSGGLVEVWTRRGPGGAGVGRPEACPDPPEGGGASGGGPPGPRERDAR